MVVNNNHILVTNTQKFEGGRNSSPPSHPTITTKQCIITYVKWVKRDVIYNDVLSKFIESSTLCGGNTDLLYHHRSNSKTMLNNRAPNVDIDYSPWEFVGSTRVPKKSLPHLLFFQIWMEIKQNKTYLINLKTLQNIKKKEHHLSCNKTGERNAGGDNAGAP